MKSLFIFLTFLVSLLANENPKVYAALGDVIYNDDEKIARITQLTSMQRYHKDIEKYLAATKHAKEIGFKIEQGDKTISNKEYLTTLRNLSKEHDTIIRRVNSAFDKSLETKDVQTFSFLSRCSLVDFSNERKQVVAFYHTYQEDINSTEVDALMLEQEQIIKKAHSKRVTFGPTDGNATTSRPVSSKLRRIREKEKAKEEAKKQAIEAASQRRKDEVQEKQKEELGL